MTAQEVKHESQDFSYGFCDFLIISQNEMLILWAKWSYNFCNEEVFGD